MNGKLIIRFYCDWCQSQGLGLHYKNLPSSKLVICQQCINSLTINEFFVRMRAYNINIQNLTLKEITDDNSLDYSTAN